MSWDLDAVAARSGKMGFSPKKEQLNTFMVDANDAFAEIKGGHLTVKQAADALHLSEGVMNKFYNESQAHPEEQRKAEDGTIVNRAASNLMSQARTNANYMKQFIDKLYKEQLKAFEGG